MSAIGRFLPNEAVRRTSGLGDMLWLYQRHALEAFRACVGDEDGHFNFAVTTLSKFLASTRGPVFEPPLPAQV
jgi:hypothetical protein